MIEFIGLIEFIVLIVFVELIEFIVLIGLTKLIWFIDVVEVNIVKIHLWGLMVNGYESTGLK